MFEACEALTGLMYAGSDSKALTPAVPTAPATAIAGAKIATDRTHATSLRIPSFKMFD